MKSRKIIGTISPDLWSTFESLSSNSWIFFICYCILTSYFIPVRVSFLLTDDSQTNLYCLNKALCANFQCFCSASFPLRLFHFFLPEIASIRYNFLKTKYSSSFQIIPSNILPKAHFSAATLIGTAIESMWLIIYSSQGCRLFLFVLYYKT